MIVERLDKAAESRGDRRLSLRTLALGGSMLPRPQEVEGLASAYRPKR